MKTSKNRLLPFLSLNLFAAGAATVLLFFPAPGISAKEPPPTSNLTYLGMMPGGRQMAMGYVACSIGDDPSSIYFNPSCLALNENNFVAVSYEAIRQSELKTEEIFQNEMLRNKNVVFLALLAPKGALSWRPLADSVWKTESAAGWEKNEFKINMFTLSAGHAHSDTAFSGLNLSYISGQIARASIMNGVPETDLSDGYGMTSDLGFLFTPADQLNFGVTLQNLFSYVWWDDFENEQLPFILRTGFSFHAGQVFTFATEWEKRYFRKAGDDDTNIIHFGAEQSLGKYLKIRMGTYGKDLNDKESTRVTAGFGYILNDFSFSLAGEKYRINMTDVFKYLLSMNIPMGSKN
ncbi:MAG: hypothetical protein ABII64_03960 [Elusimicrobiota bacterium]